jgi:hypothetical protein
MRAALIASKGIMDERATWQIASVEAAEPLA